MRNRLGCWGKFRNNNGVIRTLNNVNWIIFELYSRNIYIRISKNTRISHTFRQRAIWLAKKTSTSCPFPRKLSVHASALGLPSTFRTEIPQYLTSTDVVEHTRRPSDKHGSYLHEYIVRYRYTLLCYPPKNVCFEDNCFRARYITKYLATSRWARNQMRGRDWAASGCARHRAHHLRSMHRIVGVKVGIPNAMLAATKGWRKKS